MTDVVGLRFVSQGLEDTLRDNERYQRSLKKVNEGIKATASQSARGAVSVDRLARETLKAEREIKRLTQANVQGRISGGQFAGELNRIAARLRSLGVDRAQQQVMRFGRASQDTARALQTVNRSLVQHGQTQQRVAANIRQTETFANRLRTQFLATANTIAILDGPLGGIASRFSAFGVLLGRTGLLLAGVAVATTALITVVGRGIRSFVEWEAQTARTNAILAATGRAALLTGEQVNQMASRIALATLESEQGVQQAALRLATFRDVATDMFEDILRAAADLAAAGFGTIESEAVRIAKALEDPRQAITALSRAGITFTRQQRAMIISLIESGDRLRAMEMILENVNRRVGGAAEAAARDTYAGAWDTIRQAVGRATRALGEFVLTDTFVGRTLLGTAAILEDLARGGPTPSEVIAEAEARVAAYEAQIERLSRTLQTNTMLTAAQRAQVERTLRIVEDQRDGARQLVDSLREQAAATDALTTVERLRAQNLRRVEGADNIRDEIDLRRRLVGLTEEQARANRMLGDEGIFGIDIDREVAAFARALAAAGVEAEEAHRQTERLYTTLVNTAAVGAELVRTFQMERMARETLQTVENLERQNEARELQLLYMQQGLDATEARRRAEETLLVVRAQELAAMDESNVRLQEMADKLTLAVAESRRLEQAMNDVAAAARIRQELENTLEGLEHQLEVLDMQIVLLEQGVDFTIAQRLAEIEVARARVQTRIETEGITAELEHQLKLLNAMAKMTITIGERETQIQSFRPSRGGGGGGGRELPTLEDISGQMMQQIERQLELLDLTEQERRVRETFFDLYDRLGDARANYTEADIMAVAEQIAAQQELYEMRQRQLELQKQIADNLTTLFMAATEGAESFKRALAGLLRQLAQMLANRAFMQLVGGFTLGFGQPLPSANGNVFSGGNLVPFAQGAVIANLNHAPGANVIPFARGGVVDSPTLFPMTQGRTGLMGEAGPEAIMPLRRGRDGKLGVTAEPQQVSVDVRVHMDDNGNWQAKVERIADGRVAKAAPQIVGQSVASTYAASGERKFR